MSDTWVRFAGGEGAREVAERGPFVIAVIAELSGRDRSGEGFTPVDRDDLDALFARCALRIEPHSAGAGGEGVTLERFEDLHPDQLVRLVPDLAALLRARALAHDPAALRRALGTAGVAWDDAPLPPSASLGAGASPSGRELLAEILGEAQPPPEAPPQRDPIDALVQSIVDASSDGVDPAAAGLRRAALDVELSRRLRALLGAPRFRALEAAWRGLRDLVRFAETGESLRVRVLDVTRGQLDLAVGAIRALGPRGEGAAPALIACDVPLSSDEGDLALLEALAGAARGHGARLIAAADPGLVARAARGELAHDARWLALRARCGDSLRLVGPRVLARLPYGAATDPIDAFPFEECDDAGEAADHCWRSAALLAARAFARAVSATGSTARVSEFSQIDGLPLHATRAGTAIGPAERVLGASEREALVRAGLIAVSTVAGSDAVRMSLTDLP
jgi:hypothetical protein